MSAHFIKDELFIFFENLTNIFYNIFYKILEFLDKLVDDYYTLIEFSELDYLFFINVSMCEYYDKIDFRSFFIIMWKVYFYKPFIKHLNKFIK